MNRECVGCGGCIDGEPIYSARGTALAYCSRDCHDEYEAYLASCERHRAAIKAFRDWEDEMYARTTHADPKGGQQ